MSLASLGSRVSRVSRASRLARLAALAALVGAGPLACGSEDAALGAEDPAAFEAGGSSDGADLGAGEAAEGASPGSGSGSGADAAAPAPLGAPYPIVLLHGMAGFGTLEAGPVSLTYFEGVVADLAKNGESVYVTLAPPYDTSDVRAPIIARQLDEILARTGKAKVNLVAHSQGGFDARILASPNGLGYGDRIASVTTIATPHRGSRLADVAMGGVKYMPKVVVDQVTGALLGFLQKSAYELQTDARLRAQLETVTERYVREVFNPRYVDDPRVTYTSYAGRTNLRSGKGVCDDGAFPNAPNDVDFAQTPFNVLSVFLEEGRGKVNDGLVTVESAKWGTFQQCVPADHLKEVGMIGPAAKSFDHLAFFRDVVARIRAAGF